MRLKVITMTKKTMQTQIEDQLKKVTARIIQAFDPQRIIVFGSYAYGEPTPDSDVDLLIVMDSDERPTERARRVSSLLRPRPFPMDILVRTPAEIQHRLEIGDYFMREVMERGKVVYDRSLSKGMGAQS
jgi:predicted nucleotidyltransferase